MNLLVDGLMAIVALLLTLLLTPYSMRLAFAVGAVDRPDTRKVHAKPMPRLGGIAMAVAIFASCVMFLEINRHMEGVLLGAFIILLTGLADDIRGLQPWQKFIGEFLAAVFFVSISGVSIQSLGSLLGTGPLITGSFAVPLTVVAIVAFINALNLSDGLDGLAAGLAAIACVFLSYFALGCGNWVCISILIAVLFAIMGFLYFNTYPAKVFMGDTGSLTLGYFVAVVAVLIAEDGESRAVAPISIALVLALPVVDMFMVMVRRIYLGYSPFSPDKTHLHHRLLNLGLPHAAVVPIIYSVMALFGFIALVMEGWPEELQLMAGLVMASTVYGSVILLGKTGWCWKGRNESHGPKPYGNTVRRKLVVWLGHSVPVMTWLIPATLWFQAILLPSIPGRAALVLAMLGAVVLLLYPWTAGKDRYGVAHGLIYTGIYSVVMLNGLYMPAWAQWFVVIVSCMVAVWVALKLVFRNQRQIFLTSGFELLVIFISWCIPFFAAKLLPLDGESYRTLLMACLESIPLLLAMKIIIRRQPHRNKPLAINILAIIAYMSMKSIF